MICSWNNECFVFYSHFSDVDECAFPNLNKCDHVCKNTVPYYTCTCHKGYRLSVDGHSCIDIDECAISGNNETICPYGQRCINTHGSYECKHVCGPGLKENPIMDRCEGNKHAIDEYHLGIYFKD